MSKKQMLGLGIFIFLLLFGYNSLYVINQGQTAFTIYIPSGQTKTYGPGLRYITPLINRVYIFDTRLQTLSADSSMIYTDNQNQLLVDYYVKWQIASPLQFYKKTQGQPQRAEVILKQTVNDALRDTLGGVSLDEAVSGQSAPVSTKSSAVALPAAVTGAMENSLGDQCSQIIADVQDAIQPAPPSEVTSLSQRSQVMADIKQKVEKSAAENGIHVVDVRIKAIDLPQSVLDSVFNRMRSDRERYAMSTRAYGRCESAVITANADAEVTKIGAEANKQAATIRAEGDKVAAETYAKEYGQDPAFYKFYKSLELDKNAFANKQDIIITEPNSGFLKYFNSEPSVGSKS